MAESERFERLEQLFLAASELPPDERIAWLQSECGDDDELRQDVERLLSRVREIHGFLDAPALAKTEFRNVVEEHFHDAQRDQKVVPGLSSDGDSEAHDGETDLDSAVDMRHHEQQIGPYRLRDRLGEGGMGVVYLADQKQPIQRSVAIKLIKLGMDTEQVLTRFERERQTLALMNHPNVASVFEAGATERGQPYFVMEYVPGKPITTFCDEKRLTLRERLSLFIQGCSAIEHAHQKGIIHRDIKPSNVLVTEQNGKHVTKVIDFGVAKAVNQRLVENTIFTERGSPIGTPAYMSPEQTGMTTLDVDTRTDVYALGVLLYELLTGTLPFDPKSLRSSGFEDLQRIIREVQPCKPSTQLGKLENADSQSSSEAGAKRRLDPQSLMRQLRGDLDWITMKALEKDRTCRYDSASDLTADIQRHLGHQPVVAGPPSLAYRMRKFLRRNRVGVMNAAIIAAAFIAVIAGVTWAILAEQARREEAVKGHMANLTQKAQRGEWPAVIESLQSPLLGEYDDPIRLELWRIEALNATGQVEEAQRVVREIADRGEFGGHAAEVELWIGDILQMAGTGDPNSRIRRAIALGLPPADSAYAEALLTNSTSSAVDSLKAAVALESFHHRANSLLPVNLILCGRIDEARSRATSARHLFPGDPQFPGILALVASIEDDRETRESHLETMAQLSSDEYADRFREFLQALQQFMQANEDKSTLSLMMDLSSFVTKGAALWKPTTDGSFLRIQLPPQLQRGPRKLMDMLQSTAVLSIPGFDTTERRDQLILHLEELANAFPLCTFHALHADQLLKAGRIDEAVQAFDRAIEAPELAPGSRRQALALAGRTHLRIYEAEGDNDKGREAYERGYDLLNQYLDLGDPEPAILDGFVRLLLMSEENCLRGHQVLERAYSQESSLKLKALLASSHSIQGNHFQAMQFADAVLQESPEDSDTRRILVKARDELEKWLSEHNHAPHDPVVLPDQ